MHIQRKLVVAACLALAAALPLAAGDSLWGTVTEVKSAEIVTLSYEKGQYQVRIIGIEAPKEGALAAAARDFVARLVLGKHARMRLEGRNQAGEMVSRLQTDDPEIGIKDVGYELVHAGLASVLPGFDYKYGQLSRAQEEARKAGLGIWAVRPNR
jgi:endonuclease YncB( thermonuclease family)